MKTISLVVLTIASLGYTDANSDFDSLFGDQVKKITASSSKSDDAAFAGTLVETAGTIPESKSLQIVMCRKAYEFGIRDARGYAAAEKALDMLVKLDSKTKAEAEEMRFKIYQLMYSRSRGNERVAVAEKIVAKLLAAGDAAVADGDATEGISHYNRARTYARTAGPSVSRDIVDRIKAASSMVALENRIKTLKAKIEKDPKDSASRETLILIYLFDLDRPAAAVKLLGSGVDEELALCVKLAAGGVEKVPTEDCVPLGNWYRDQSPGAITPAGKGRALQGAIAAYERFLATYKESDVRKLKAKLLLSVARKDLEKLGSAGMTGFHGLFEDFEGETYGKWRAEGVAFGRVPGIAGIVNRSYPAVGIKGRKMASSYHISDDSRGTLTSQKFRIGAKTISFLVGGGNHPGDACMNLIVDGKIVRTVTGKNNNTVSPHQWDVSDLVGKTACFQIVDNRVGHWGHIIIDHIVIGDEKK